jgi:enoyl-CoA hydratase/carnithine racemase
MTVSGGLTMNNDSQLLLELHGDVAVISLNRPDRLNAVGPGFADELAAAAREARSHREVRAFVLTGEGRAFCAGADVSSLEQREYGQATPESFPIDSEGGWPIGWFGMNLPLPVVCAVNGAAVGYGAELLATCDMRIAGESARIGWVFARRGLVTDMGVGPVMLPAIVGHAQAARLLYSGEIVSATEALRIGLVDEVVPDAELRKRAIDVARQLGAGAPNAIAVMKRQLYASLRDNPHEIYFRNLEEFERSMASEDFKEGVRSFMEKRAPQWTGR